MRIDVHTHLKPMESIRGRCTADKIKRYRDNGVDKIVLIEPFDVCMPLAEQFDDFIIPVALVNMNEESARGICGYLDRGVCGIKFIAPNFPYGDERYWPLYEVLERYSKPAIFHTGYLTHNFPYFEWGNQSIELMRAAQIDIIARRFPNLKILMAHFSNPWWEEAWKICFSNENVYADLSGGTAYIRSLAMWSEMFAPDGNILFKSFERLCFASDVCYFGEEAAPFDVYIEFYERLFDRVGLPEHYRDRVNYKNAEEIFGIGRDD